MKLSVSPPVSELAPGDDLELLVTIANDGDQQLAPTLTIAGVDPVLVTLPDALVILEPGESASALIGVRFPASAAPGEQRLGLSVTDPDGLHEPVTVSATIRVGARPDVAVALLPTATEGRRGAKLSTVLLNRSSAPLYVVLDAEGTGVDVDFAADELRLEPGEELHVPTRLRRVETTWFRERRHGALVQVRGEGAPVSAAATFTQRPWFPAWLWKTAAILALIGLWGGLVYAIQDRFLGDDAEFAKRFVLTAEARAAFAAAARGDVVEAEPVDLGPGAPVVVQGAVTGPTDPAGTAVTLEQIGFGEEGTTSGETRLAALTPVASTTATVLPRIDTSTDERGAFRFTGDLEAPAFYRITARRPGFDVASAVVSVTDDARQAEVELVLVPAVGGLSGRVTDTNGTPLGGADITVTDGSITYSATSATEGGVGAWSLSGVATPATYEVTVALPGYATETLRVSLAGGQQLGGVDAQLAAGLGTIRGRVTYRGDGVGAVTVELVGNPTQRTTTTVTEPAGLRGAFDFPRLAYGTYRLTFSAPGWLTQTSEVVVDRGDVEVNVTDLLPSTAIVDGRVLQEVAPGGRCEYPDPADPTQRERAELQPCGGVGVTIVGADQTWRTTTANGTGRFELAGIPTGEYLVRFERFGYVSQFFDVAVSAGDIRTLPRDARASSDSLPIGADDVVSLAGFSLANAGDAIQLRLLPPIDEATGVVQGVIRDATDPASVFDPPAGTRISVDGQAAAVVERLAEGAFVISGLQPGASTVRIQAPGYDVLTQVVRVAFGTTTDAGILAITPLGSLALRITGGQASVVGEAEVFVTADPFAYEGTNRRLPVIEASGDATSCRRTITLDGEERTLQGLCAMTDSVGDVEFRRTFGTGNFVLAVPLNEVDVADQEERRATTVPLDHERLIRRVDIESGQTVRLDPNLRRYPIVTGVIRAPGPNEGLVAVDVQREDITFRPINELGDEVVLPADAPRPRISAAGDPGSTLSAGQYRIDRIPADTPNAEYQWELIINAGGTVFERTIGQPGGTIDGLQFNEIRTISAILQPAPQELRFVLDYLDADGDEQPVPGGLLRLFGISGYEALDVAPFFVAISAACPSNACEMQTESGVLRFATAGDAGGRVVGTGDAARLATGVAPFDAPGEFTLPPFYRPGPLDILASAPGFEPVELDAFDVVAPDDGPVIIPIRMQPRPRPISGTVRLDPASVTYPGFLAALGLGSEAALLGGLTVRLEGPGGVDGSVPLDTTTGAFRSTAVPPGSYTLSITGPGVEEVLDLPVLVEPADGDVVVPSTATTLVRTGFVRVGVTSNAPTRPLPGFTAQLERRVPPAAFEADGAALVCPTGSVSPTVAFCTSGAVTYPDLALAAGTEPYEYRVTVSQPGWIPAETAPSTLRMQPYADLSLALDRWGELGGIVRGRIGADEPDDGLDGVTVTLVDLFSRAPIVVAGESVTTTTDVDGAFSFPATLELAPRDGSLLREVCEDVPVEVPDGLGGTITIITEVCSDQEVLLEGDRYGLSFSKAGYETVDLPDPFMLRLNSVVDDLDVVVDALPTSITGVVQDGDGTPLFLDAEGGGVEVTVRIRSIDGTLLDEAARPSVTTTGPDGAFLFDGLEARTYVLEFITTDPPRPTLVFDPIMLAPGEDRDLGIVTLADAFGSVTGTVRLERYTGQGGTLPVGSAVEVRAWTEDGERPDVAMTSTAADGTYSLPDLLPGTYTVEFALAGYDTTATGFSVIVTAAGVTTRDAVLTATRIPVEVTVSSTNTSLSGTINGRINGARVVATDVTATLPAAPVDDVTSGSGANAGRVTLMLPPGDWRIGVPGAEDPDFLPRPHAVPTLVDRTFAAGGTAAAVSFSLSPFLEIAGTVAPRAFAGGPTPAEFDGATVRAERNGVTRIGIVGASSAEQLTSTGTSPWAVYIPPPTSGGTQWTVTLAATGYGPMSVGSGNLNSQSGDVNIAQTVELVARPVAVRVTAQSSVPPADADDPPTVLEGATVQATWVGPTPPPSAGFTTSGTTGPGGVASLSLAPGTWDIRVDGATVTTLAHGVVTAREAIPVTAQGDTVDIPVVLPAFQSLTGQVRARAFPGADPSGDPTAAVTAVAASGGPITGVIGAFTNGVATWSVDVPPTEGAAVTWTVTVEADGYEDGSEARTLAADGTVTPVGVGIDLIATPVDVPVTVASADAALGALSGVTVTASWAGTGSGPDDGGDYDLSGTTTATGVQLTLAPGPWTLSTAGAQSATFSPRPHADVSDVDLSVAVGGDLDPDPVALTLTPYVSVSGTVATSDGAGGTPALAADVTVATTVLGALIDTGQPADRTVTGAGGTWKVWLPTIPAADAPITVTFTLEGYDIEPLTISRSTFVDPDDAEALLADVVLPADEPVILDPSVQDVTVEVTSALGAVSLTGLTLRAERDIDGSPASEDATVTVMDGVVSATFTGLLPGAWLVRSTNAPTTSRGVGALPHVDAVDVELVVPIGGSDDPVTGFIRYAGLIGTVAAEAYAEPVEPEDDPPGPEPLVGATVTVTQTVGAGDDAVDVSAAATTVAGGAWSLGVLLSTAASVTWTASGYEASGPDAVAAASLGSPTVPVDLGEEVLLPITAAATVTAEDGVTPIVGAEVEAVWVGEGTVPAVRRVTDVDGVALFALQPGTWQFDVINATGYYDKTQPESEGPDPQELYTSPPPTIVTCCDTPASVTFALTSNSVLYGRVVELRGGDEVAVPGVTVRASREGESFSTVSDETGQDGLNYRLRMRSGTWRITATRDGETIVVDEAFVVAKDGPGSPPNRLDIVLPPRSVDLAGQVLAEGGAAVQGASIVATSTVGTVTATSGEDGSYELGGLDNTVTWTVTFSPPAGYEGRPVTRYVALSGNLSATLALDQVLPSSLGAIELRVTGGEPGVDIAVALEEAAAFLTINADGRLDRGARLDGDGAVTVLFEDLVPGDGRSVPQDRFTLVVVAPGLEPVTRSGVDVSPGGTTVVSVDLGVVPVVMREVELSLTSGGEPLNDRTVLLQDGVSTIPSTVESGTNRYRFASVAPGTWSVVVDGYEPAPVTVTAGQDALLLALDLVALVAEPLPESEEGTGADADPDVTDTDPDLAPDAPGDTDPAAPDDADPGAPDGVDPAAPGSGDTSPAGEDSEQQGSETHGADGVDGAAPDGEPSTADAPGPAGT